MVKNVIIAVLSVVLTLIYLRIGQQLNWPWVWVLSPIWISILILAITLVVVFLGLWLMAQFGGVK